MDPVKQGYSLVTQHMVMYNDCNTTDFLFGGRLLAWIDEAAGLYLREFLDRTHLVTARIDEMSFSNPTKLGETVRIYCKIEALGKSSATVTVYVNNLNYGSQHHNEIARTKMVWVSVNQDGRPEEHGKKMVS